MCINIKNQVIQLLCHTPVNQRERIKEINNVLGCK